MPKLTTFSIAFFLFLSVFSNTLLAQDTYKANQSTSFEVGIEFQVYPTGIISGLHLESAINEKSAILAQIGYNLVRHRDLGKHDDERGGGFGGSLGYRHYFKSNRQGFLIGARTGLWFNTVDWKNDPNLVSERAGQSKITVFQPTAEIGYVINGDKDGLIFVPTIAFGAEINVKTNGADVGEGAILLLGFTIGKRF